MSDLFGTQIVVVFFTHRLKSFSQVLCGNKTDLTSERQVSKDQGEELAKKLNISYVECSAKTGDGVISAFETLVRTTPRPGFAYKVC